MDNLSTLTEAQRDQKTLAGKGRWRQLVAQALEKYPDDLDRAARWLSGKMRRYNFDVQPAISRRYMERWAQALGRKESGHEGATGVPPDL